MEKFKLMSREILFRGKRVDNGEWIYGSLVTGAFVKSATGQDIPYIFNTDECDAAYCFEDLTDDYGYYEVDPATVGQFTGLTDKNGVPIFEGDILGDWNDIDGVMTQSKLQVFWDSKAGAWALDNSYNQDKSSGDLLSEELVLSAYEVIGTIHDTHLTKQS